MSKVFRSGQWRKLVVVFCLLSVLALSFAAVGAQATPMTLDEISTETYTVVQTWGLIPFLMFFAIVGAAAFLFKRMKSAAR